MLESWTGNNTGTNAWDLISNWSNQSDFNSSLDTVSISKIGTYQVRIVTTDPAYTTQNVSLGGLGSDPMLLVNGELSIEQNAALTNHSNVEVGPQGSVTASNVSVGVGSVILDAGTLTVGTDLSGSGSVVVDNAKLFSKSISGSNSYTLLNGASMTVTGNLASSGHILFGQLSSNILILDSPPSKFGASITGFSPGDAIDIRSLSYSNTNNVSWHNSSLTVYDGSGQTLIEFLNMNNPGSVSLASDGSGGTKILPNLVSSPITNGATSVTNSFTCYLAGTRIEPDSGEKAIELLSVGDLIACLVDGKIIHRPITWIGSRRLDKSFVAQTGIYPIRIVANAFSKGVPRRDLLITPEHCIFIEGCLIPVRMLENGASIYVDRTVDAFRFYHIELDSHEIVFAEGLPAESYLDTGNRAGFSHSTSPSIHNELMPSSPKNWVVDACARLATDRDTVEPFWVELADRASHLGLKDQRGSCVTTNDPSIQILLSDGRIITPCVSDASHTIFSVPKGGKPVRLLSNASVPAEVIGPFVDDRRKLGVQVRSVSLQDGGYVCRLNAGDLSFNGWHALEHDVRWTNGDASLVLPEVSTSNAKLQLETTGTLPYRCAKLLLLAA